MVAARDLKYAARVGENAFLDVLDPGPVHAHRHLVLGFTRHRAGVTSDALAVIDYEAVFHPRGLDPEQLIILGSDRSGSYGIEPACKAEKNNPPFISCHPERSEGSAVRCKMQIPRFARDDKIGGG
jgi:hypothetical protein